MLFFSILMDWDYNEIKIFPGTGRYDAKNNAYMKGN